MYIIMAIEPKINEDPPMQASERPAHFWSFLYNVKGTVSCLLQNTVFISESHQNSKKRRDRKGRERKKREQRGEKGRPILPKMLS